MTKTAIAKPTFVLPDEPDYLVEAARVVCVSGGRVAMVKAGDGERSWLALPEIRIPDPEDFDGSLAEQRLGLLLEGLGVSPTESLRLSSLELTNRRAYFVGRCERFPKRLQTVSVAELTGQGLVEASALAI